MVTTPFIFSDIHCERQVVDDVMAMAQKELVDLIDVEGLVVVQGTRAR